MNLFLGEDSLYFLSNEEMDIAKLVAEVYQICCYNQGSKCRAMLPEINCFYGSDTAPVLAQKNLTADAIAIAPRSQSRLRRDRDYEPMAES